MGCMRLISRSFSVPKTLATNLLIKVNPILPGGLNPG